MYLSARYFRFTNFAYILIKSASAAGSKATFYGLSAKTQNHDFMVYESIPFQPAA